MTRLRQILSSLFILALLASTVSAQIPLNRVIASIDGEPITLFELDEYVAKRSAAMPTLAGSASRQDMLQALITEKLVKKEIDTMGIRVAEEDIDHYVERIREQNRLTEDQLKQALRQQGLTWEQYRSQIRGEIEKIQLLNREIRGRVNITPEDIERFYEKNKSDYATGALVHLRHIVLRVGPEAPEEVVEAVQERAEEIRRRIVKGKEDFAEVAKQVSEDGAAGQGGDLGELEPDKILPEFDEALEKLKIGEVSQPIRTEGGIHLLRIDKRIAKGFTPIEEVSDKIKEDLYNKALDERYRRWLLEDLQKRHYVEIRL